VCLLSGKLALFVGVIMVCDLLLLKDLLIIDLSEEN
jgi:hypothetical protein